MIKMALGSAKNEEKIDMFGRESIIIAGPKSKLTRSHGRSLHRRKATATTKDTKHAFPQAHPTELRSSKQSSSSHLPCPDEK